MHLFCHSLVVAWSSFTPSCLCDLNRSLWLHCGRASQNATNESLAQTPGVRTNASWRVSNFQKIASVIIDAFLSVYGFLICTHHPHDWRTLFTQFTLFEIHYLKLLTLLKYTVCTSCAIELQYVHYLHDWKTQFALSALLKCTICTICIIERHYWHY